MIYISLHDQPDSLSESDTNFGIPHASDTVLVRDGRVSDRSKCDGGGSRGVGVDGIERKWRDGEDVARQMYLCVGDTESDHNGGEGIGYVDWALVLAAIFVLRL